MLNRLERKVSRRARMASGLGSNVDAKGHPTRRLDRTGGQQTNWLATEPRRCTTSPASMLRLLPFLTALLMALLTSPTQAEPSPSEIAVARELFEQGKLLQDRGEWSRANAQYRKALDIKDTPGLRYRVGYCEEQLGNLVEAGVEYDRARELLESGVRADDVAELLPRTIASLQRRTPSLTLVLQDPPPNVVLRIDGDLLAPAVVGKSIPLNPGKHSIVVSAPGYRSFAQTVGLAEGERKRLRVSLARASAGSAPHDDGQTSASRSRGT